MLRPVTLDELQDEIVSNLKLIKEFNKDIKILILEIKKSKNGSDKLRLRKKLIKTIYQKRIKLKINRINKQEMYYEKVLQNKQHPDK